ncbi:hypothetical protein J5N97_015946 [Dioscorea zingiberensis]|uniref:Band 7 domain-containing protein n=1 Tax=Dioscorea zingiberensis TaxID=325984 RepID=A0A9D5HEQ8_9LILI|nr:hypothetical protein J5N97_015946 [Dioscorea zingiberensis]
MNPQSERPQFNPVRQPAARAEAADESLAFFLTVVCFIAAVITVWSILVVVALPADYVKVSQVLLLAMSITNGTFSILHQVPEGHVGVYWRGGALLDTITDPGFHLKFPLITHFEPIQVTLQTDEVKDIPCGTKGGVMISFDKIEVVNRLRKDHVYDTLLNYGALIAIEKQKVAEIEAESQKKVELAEAEKNSQVSKILMEQKLMEKNSVKRQEEIENEIFMSREKSLADASFYRLMKEAEANKLKLTPQFLELKFIEAIAYNSKIYFGDKVPNMFLDQRLLGNSMHGVVKKDTE